MVEVRLGPRKIAVSLGVIVALSACAWKIVSDTAAENLALSSPSTALFWNSRQPDALDRLSQQELASKTGHVALSESLAGAALLSNPLDEQALLLLGMIADRKGDRTTAEKLIQLAGSRTWRNLTTQLWLMEHAIRSNAFRSGLEHADAMLRIRPDLLDQLLPLLAAYTIDPRALDAMAEFLATDPPWRELFVRVICRMLVDKAHLDDLFARLRDSKSPPKPIELAAYLQRLVNDGRFQTAYDYWRSGFGSDRKSVDHLLYNGDFMLPGDDTPFNWTIQSVSGAEIRIVPIEGGQHRALRIQFSGARVVFQNVSQVLLLPPGSYTYSGLAKAAGLTTQRGIRWEVSCLTGNKQRLAKTGLVSRPMPWTEFKTTFDIPSEGCAAQSLTLTLPARIDSEKRIEGEVWFRNLRIDPAGAGS